MNLPIYYIDTMKYKNYLSERDKNYIAFHSMMSYFGISREQLIQMVNDNNVDIYSIVNNYKNQLSDIFLLLKENGNLNKNNMFQLMSQIIKLEEIFNQYEMQSLENQQGFMHR